MLAKVHIVKWRLSVCLSLHRQSWLISTNGFGFQTLSLHCIMHNFFHWFLFWFRSLYSFPNGYCTHFRDGSLSQGQISVPIPYIWIRGSESESEPVEKSCTVQESESESVSGSGNKPLGCFYIFTKSLVAQLIAMFYLHWKLRFSKELRISWLYSSQGLFTSSESETFLDVCRSS